MRVAIAEDDDVYRAGLVELLTAADVEVACQAVNCRDLLDYLHRDRPDVVLLDIRFKGPPDEGLLAAEEISKLYPKLAVLLLSNHVYNEYVRRFFAHGMSGRGYLLKERFNNIEDVRHALDLVHRGKTYSDTTVLDMLRSRQPTLTEILTPREIDILRLVAAAFTNAAIAVRLKINEDKVENAIKSINKKLGYDPERNPRVYAAIRWLHEMPEDQDGSAATKP
jgi:DNA-binding NarL/FixJ family response regulator